MTAPALNLTPTAPGAAGPAAANAAAGAQPGAAATGFDALIAALFPAGPSAAPTVGPTTGKADGEDVAEATIVEGGAPAAATTLAAAATVQLLPTNETPATAKAADDVPTPAQPAPGQAKGRPAFAAAPAQPPGLALSDETASDAVEGEDDPSPAAGQPAKAGPHADKPDPPAFGRDKPHGAPAQPALDNANPKADLAAKAAAAGGPEPIDPAEVPPASPAPEAATAAAIESAEASALTAQAARPEPTPAAARPGRGERRGATSETTEAPGAARRAEAGDRPVHAKAAQPGPAAGTLASDTVDAVEPNTGESRAELDQPDAAPQGETRAAAQGPAAAAHEAHVARGTPETVANLAAQIVKKLEAKTTRFDIELDPHGLGRVDVRVEIGAHGKMTASMVFENPQAAHELKSRAAELQRVMEQAGFDLSGGLSFDLADQGRQQGQAWQDQAETGLGFRGQAFRAALETAGEAADAATTGALRLRRGVNAGVDVRI